MKDSKPVPQDSPTVIYRLADSMVLIGVRFTERGPEPLCTELDGAPCAVAYTDPQEIRRDLPDGYRLYQISVPELLAQLPPTAGMLLNPRAATPVYVPPEQREAVIAAGRPFPAGALIKIKAGAQVPGRLLEVARPRLEQVAALRRLYSTRYRVTDAREKALLAYDVDPGAGADAAVCAALLAAAAEINVPDPMQIIALDDVPEQFRRTILADVPPSYVRADLRDERG